MQHTDGMDEVRRRGFSNCCELREVSALFVAHNAALAAYSERFFFTLLGLSS